MKLLYSILTLLVFSLYAKAQINIVPNPNFEEYHTCPPFYLTPQALLSIENYCDNWRMFTALKAPGNVCYYNSCNTQHFGVPANYFGNQKALTGNAYAGLVMRFALNNRGYLAVDIPALDTSHNYEVSFSVSLADTSNYALNGWGVLFYKVKWMDTNTGSCLPINPQIRYPGNPIADTAHWTRLTAIYKPDSAYTHLVIGSFVNDFEADVITIIPVGQGGKGGYSYYYIDSVVMRIKYDPIVCKYKGLFICPGDTIRVPFVFKGGVNSGNTFSVQLSKATDSFKSPVIIGTKAGTQPDSIVCIVPKNIAPGLNYRIRVVADSSYIDSFADNGSNIRIDSPHPVIFTAVKTKLCEGEGIFLSGRDTSNVSTAYNWQGPAGFYTTNRDSLVDAVIAQQGGDYIFTAIANSCVARDTIHFDVHAYGNPKLTVNSPLCLGDTLHLHSGVIIDSAKLNWIGPQGFKDTIKEPMIVNVQLNASGLYKIVTTNHGCTDSDKITVLVKPRPQIAASSNSPVAPDDELLLEVSTNDTGIQYQWTGPNDFSSNEQNPVLYSIKYNLSGTYIVTATIDSCSNTDSVQVAAAFGDSTYFVVYPNPNDGRFTLKGHIHQNEVVQIRIADLAGQLIYEGSAQTVRRGLKKQINISQVANGQYILYLRAGGQKYTIPFIVGR